MAASAGDSRKGSRVFEGQEGFPTSRSPFLLRGRARYHYCSRPGITKADRGLELGAVAGRE